MSMTLIAFVNKADLPVPMELETLIQSLGYDFRFTEAFDHLEDFDGDCVLEGQKTFFEAYLQPKREIIAEMPSLETGTEEYDSAVSFSWGADAVGGASILLICVALMDLCNSKVLSEDFETWYAREELLEDISMLLALKDKPNQTAGEISKAEGKRNLRKLTDPVLWGVLIVTIILMQRDLLSWIFPALVLAAVQVLSMMDQNEKRKRDSEGS